jgi:hypothetical protein
MRRKSNSNTFPLSLSVFGHHEIQTETLPAVENGAFNFEVFSNPCSEIRKATESISVSGDQFSMAGLNVSESTETINLQFKEKLIRIKRLFAAGKPYRA